MPDASGIRKASASAPGTCGELAQGMLDGALCMVTCPIDMRSTATVALSPGDGSISAPGDSPKAARAVMATLEFLGEPAVDAELWLDSRIPRGKGMASSTADVSAAIVATAGALSQEMSPEQIAEIALGIEPSDGVMFPKIVIFDHLQGRTARPLGSPPPMRVAVLDFGGEVDTLEFNNTERENALRCLQTKMTEAASLIERGIREKDYLLVGRGATISSFANQEILFKPHLDAVIEFANEVGAAGVNVAHSGTVIGLLFPDNAVLVERAVAVAPHRLDRLESVMQCRVTGGGVWRL